MSKAKQVILVIAGVVMLYIIVSVFIVFLSDTSVSVNAELAATTNLSNYSGLSEFLLASPWIMYVAPAVVGIIAIIGILKGEAIAEAVRQIRLR